MVFQWFATSDYVKKYIKKSILVGGLQKVSKTIGNSMVLKEAQRRIKYFYKICVEKTLKNQWFLITFQNCIKNYKITKCDLVAALTRNGPKTIEKAMFFEG